MGYTGKITKLINFVRLYRGQPKKQATLRNETSQGKQAQNLRSIGRRWNCM